MFVFRNLHEPSAGTKHRPLAFDFIQISLAVQSEHPARNWLIVVSGCI